MAHFIRVGGQIFGPFDESQLLEMKSKGKISRSTEISENKRDWQAAETCAFLYANAAPQQSQPSSSPSSSSVNDLVGRFRRANARAQYEEPVPEQTDADLECDLMFEVRVNGKRATVTKSKLFELARTGAILPDDLVIIDGTKVYADTIRGIAFGNASSMNAPPPPESALEIRTRLSSSLGKSVSAELSDDPPYQENESVMDKLRNTYQLLFRRSDTSDESDSIPRGSKIVIACCILGILCLIGVGYFFMNIEWNNHGTINITGTVTLDGEPLSGVSVILHPHDANGSVAGGITRRGGRFTVTTDVVFDPTDPLRGTARMVSGALPGVYDITFHKLADSNPAGALTPGERRAPEHLVPQRYGDTETSGKSITIERGGQRAFIFPLTRQVP